MNTRPPNASDPIGDRDLLEDARRAMRRKALECLAEADRLDALYAAVTTENSAAPARKEVLS
jgi:hypothetical protein